jgi:hypothetical protein
MKVLISLCSALVLSVSAACTRTSPAPRTTDNPVGEPSPSAPTQGEAPPLPGVETLKGPPTIGSGELAQPAVGPAPGVQRKIGGAPFVLVKNWDFGAQGTIRNTQDLIAEFEFHDQFNTIANGTHYGSVIVAPTPETAISVTAELGLPDNRQPVEDPKRPVREFTPDTLKAHVLPLSAAQKTVSVKAHNAGCGSLMAKWRLPSGGKGLQKELLWETRVRMSVPKPGYWFALWTSGDRWDKGAEMDVVEAFGAPHLMEAKVFHVNSVGGEDRIEFDNWFKGLETAGVPESNWDLTRFHTWTWVYKTDDSYEVYYDGQLTQTGTLHWTLGAKPGAPNIDMRFLFDFAWGHTLTPGVDVTLPASTLPLTYEIDYSRVYLR